MPQAVERTGEVDGLLVRWWAADAPGPPVVYVHGAAAQGAQWHPFLERTGGLAPDLSGLGGSAKRADLPYDLASIAARLGAFLDAEGVDRLHLVVHGWGALALVWAAGHPERIASLVVLNAVPLLEGHRWRGPARVWRTRGLGELAMGLGSRWAVRQLSRRATARRRPLPRELTDLIWAGFDTGTARTLLRLHRTADPDALADAGRDLGALRCPALVLWGDRDRDLPADLAERYAAALAGCDVRVEHVPDAGHWPWVDRPDVLDRVVAFLDP